MPLHLNASDPDFESAFAAFLATKREVSEDVDAAVRSIIAQVRAHGDEAIIELTRRFDRLDLAATAMRVSEAEIAAAVAACDAADHGRARAGVRTHRIATIAASFPRTTATRTRSVPSSARAGRRSSWSASTSRAGSPATRAPC